MASPSVLTFGPPSGVLSTTEPYDDVATGDYCQNATNGYFRDPVRRSGFQARPGFSLQNNASPFAGTGGPGVHVHVDPVTGTVYRFYAAGGKLYRANDSNTTFTDVTPTGTSFANTIMPFAMASVGGSMVCSDGADRPWVLSNFASTPVTRTYIDIDGASGAWSAFGPPTIYQDSVFWITATVPSGSAAEARVSFVWSEPNQPAVGYTQSGYANFWNVIQTGTDPLTAIWGTNNGLYFWRAQSIGVASGTPSINFSTTATRDSKSEEVGTAAPFAVQQYGNYLYFLDLGGRPYRMSLDGEPEPIWQQLPAVITAQNISGFPAQFGYTATAALVPSLNLYLYWVWASNPFVSVRPTTMYVFDAQTGRYAGSWALNPATGVVMLGVTRDSDGANQLALLDENAKVWCLSSLASFLSGKWKDNGAVPVISVQTSRMGYNATNVYQADIANIVTMSAAPLTVSVQTPYTSSTIEATAASTNASSDGTYRTVIGLDVVAAREMNFTVSPTTADSQWGFQRLEVPVNVSLAGPEDR